MVCCGVHNLSVWRLIYLTKRRMNAVNTRTLKGSEVYRLSLGFNDATINHLVESVYEMESRGARFSSDCRTFVLTRGFHSCNLLDRNILREFPVIRVCCSRLQELMYNHLVTEKINYRATRGSIRITEIWFNILENIMKIIF